jgi:uncharacterized RDD family membrane protein YckC
VNCPSCGLLNLSTADICVYCKAPLEEFLRADEAKKNVVDWNEAKSAAAAVKGKVFLADSSPRPKISDWRAQLNLKLDRLKEKESVTPSGAKEKLLGEIRNREFAKLSKGQLHEAQKDLLSPSPPVNHPLAQKTLEKLNRVSQAETTNPQTPVVEAPQPPQPLDSSAESTVQVRRAKKGSSKPEKVERIEINLSQGALPFDEAENSRVGVEEDLRKGLAAAALSLRIRAGAIDALFICGCFLIFLMIVFFVPDFVFFSRSSFLGLATVAVIIANGYVFLLTALSARTLGMDHEHLRVISFDGRFPTLRESSLRSFGYFISLGCFCLGFLWGVFDPQKLTWHDRISKTLIVSKDRPT